MQGVPLLPEAVVEVTDLISDYGGDCRRVHEEVMGINRTNENGKVATARVHVVVIDRSVWEIGQLAFYQCSNLVKVTAPFVEELREYAFDGVFNLRNVTSSPDDVVVKSKAFF